MPWKIDSIDFTPFSDGAGEGFSASAVCVSNDRKWDYSVSRYREVDETDEALKERIADAVVTEINDPARASLIDRQFAPRRGRPKES